MAGYMYLGSQKVCPAIVIGGGGDELNVGYSVDQDGKLLFDLENIVFSGFNDIGDYTFIDRFHYNEFSLVDLSNLTEISGELACEEMFYECYLTSVDLSNLTTISGIYACDKMFLKSSISSIDLSNLTTISGEYSCGEMFVQSDLSSIDLSSLTTISGEHACSMMFGYSSISSIDLSGLTTISGKSACSQMFYNCKNLKNLSFPSLKTISNQNAFFGLITVCSNVTIHFPSNMQSIIQGLSGYPNFSGTNTTLLFDLPSTE